MIRATTPKHMFIFDTDPSVYERILITYAQNGEIIIEKGKDDLTIEEITDSGVQKYNAWFRLTQEEANKFSARMVAVQVRVLTTSGEALASEQMSFRVEDVLNDEVLV